MAKQYSDPELGAMPNVNSTGLNDESRIMNKVNARIGSKQVPRKTAPKKARTPLIRTGKTTPVATNAIKPGAQGNAASTTTGVNSGALQAAAARLLSKK